MNTQKTMPAAQAILGGAAYEQSAIDRLWDEPTERAAIAVALEYDGAFEVMSALVKAEDFWKLSHQYLWQSMQDLLTDGEAVNPVTVANRLRKTNKFDAIGGHVALANITADIVHAEGARSYASIVHDYAQRRALLSATDAIRKEVFDMSVPFTTAARRADGILEKVIVPDADRWLVPAYAATNEVLDYVESAMDGKLPKAVTTGLRDLDDIIGGWTRRRLHALVGCTGIGKSLALYNAALDAAKAGFKVALWSLEITRRDVMLQLIAMEAELSWDTVRDGKLSPEDYNRFLTASQTVANLPLAVNDGTDISPRDIYTEAKRMKETFGLDAVFVDYYQLVQGVSAEHERETLTRLKYVSNALLTTAKKLDVAVVMAAQAKPTVADKQDKRPGMYDIADCSQLSKDADVIIGLYRDDYYNEATEYSNQFDFIVRKNRIRNKYGTAAAYFNKACGRLRDGAKRKFYLGNDYTEHEI